MIRKSRLVDKMIQRTSTTNPSGLSVGVVITIIDISGDGLRDELPTSFLFQKALEALRFEFVQERL